jgi:hypothetical protein
MVVTDTDQTLVVTNVHAVNFSFGTGAFEKQFEEIRQVLDDHDGPIILSRSTLRKTIACGFSDMRLTTFTFVACVRWMPTRKLWTRPITIQ